MHFFHAQMHTALEPYLFFLRALPPPSKRLEIKSVGLFPLMRGTFKA